MCVLQNVLLYSMCIYFSIQTKTNKQLKTNKLKVCIICKLYTKFVIISFVYHNYATKMTFKSFQFEKYVPKCETLPVNLEYINNYQILNLTYVAII